MRAWIYGLLMDSGGGGKQGWEGDRVCFKEKEEFVVVLHTYALLSLSPSVSQTAEALSYHFTHLIHKHMY